MTMFPKYLKQIYRGPNCSDATHVEFYEVEGDVTVRQLIADVMSMDTEWGYVGIYAPHYFGADYISACYYGLPRFEYKYSSSVTEIAEVKKNFAPVLDKFVSKVRWDGGWSRGDWLLCLKGDEVPFYAFYNLKEKIENNEKD